MKVKYYLDGIVKVVEKLEVEIVTLKRKNLELLTPKGRFQSYAEDYIIVDMLTDFKNYPNLVEDVEELKQKDLQLVEENNKIYNQNRAIFFQVIAEFEALGLETKQGVWKRRKWQTVETKWYKEICEYFFSNHKPKYSKEYIQRKWNNWLDAYNKHQEELNKAKRQKELCDIWKDKCHKLINDIEDKLSPSKITDYDYYYSTWNEILQAVKRDMLEADNYLNLAVIMENTRLNWSDGFDQVTTALGKLDLSVEQNNEIYTSINDLISNDVDGRVLRDCKWNYDTIYGLADIDRLDFYNRAIYLLAEQENEDLY